VQIYEKELQFARLSIVIVIANNCLIIRSYFLLSFQSFLIKLASRFIKKGFSLPSGLVALVEQFAISFQPKNLFRFPSLRVIPLLGGIVSRSLQN
jgi:hypothetical protein